MGLGWIEALPEPCDNCPGVPGLRALEPAAQESDGSLPASRPAPRGHRDTQGP